VIDENPDRLEASYAQLVPILVKALQEATSKIEVSSQCIEVSSQRIETLEAKVAALESA
jgi:hypothetical protein